MSTVKKKKTAKKATPSSTRKKTGSASKLITIKSPSPAIEDSTGERIKKRLIQLNFNLQIDEYEETVIRILQNKGKLIKNDAMGHYIYENSKLVDPSCWGIGEEEVERLISFGILEKHKDEGGDDAFKYILTKLGKSIQL